MTQTNGNLAIATENSATNVEIITAEGKLRNALKEVNAVVKPHGLSGYIVQADPDPRFYECRNCAISDLAMKILNIMGKNIEDFGKVSKQLFWFSTNEFGRQIVESAIRRQKRGN